MFAQGDFHATWPTNRACLVSYWFPLGYENLQRGEIINIHLSKSDLVVKGDFYGFLLMMETLSLPLLLITS